MHRARTLDHYREKAKKTRERRNLWKLFEREPRAKKEGEALIMFASGAGANSKTLDTLSFLADFSDRRNLIRLKKQIINGEMETFFLTERIVEKRGSSALGITEYLGKKKVDLCIKAALRSKTLPEERGGLGYLQWAAQNGAPEVRERALAGLAVIFGEKLRNQDSLIVRGSMLHANENAALLRKELGKEKADMLLNERQKGGKAEHWAIVSLFACLGVGLGSAAGFLHELGAAGRPELRFAAVFGLASLAAFVTAEISRARALPFLAERIGGMLAERKGKAGQL